MFTHPQSIQWLTQLAILFPIKQALLLGTERGACDWISWLQQQAIPRINLIEADTEAAGSLKTETGNRSGWETHYDLIAEQTGSATFYHTNLSSENGLIPPQKLTAIWPNIETIQQQTRSALSLQDFARQNNLHPDLLIINYLGAHALLQNADNVLENANIIIAKASQNIESLPEADISLLTEYLQTQNFKLIETESGRHPHILYAVFFKDHVRLNQSQQQKTQELKQQLLELKQKLAAQESKIKQTKKWKQAAKEYKQTLSTLYKKEQNTTAMLQQHNEALSQQYTQLLQHIDTRFNEQTTQPAARPSENVTPDYGQLIQKTEKNVINTLTQRLNNSTTQLEAYFAIHNFLNTGNLLSGFHGWPISPDIGLFIINQMRQKQYDLVIEFGSGTSTLLFAKLVAAEHHQKLMSDLLPQKIISFEHHVDFYKQTKDLLTVNGFSQYVDLVHAPLIEWVENEQIFFYYDCKNKLEQLSKQIDGKKINILVLVDGPPGNTCKDARYPAIPFLFEHLENQQFDIILDDSKRPQEKAVIQKWQEFWSSKGIGISDKQIDSEKGIYLATTNN